MCLLVLSILTSFYCFKQKRYLTLFHFTFRRIDRQFCFLHHIFSPIHTHIRSSFNNTVHSSEPQHNLICLFLQRLGKVVEDRKPFAIATSEENKPKNRYDYVLPYDSNRVILAPLSTRPSSTYINASFVTVSWGSFLYC